MLLRTPPLVYITPSLYIHPIPREPPSASRKRSNSTHEKVAPLKDLQRGLPMNENGTLSKLSLVGLLMAKVDWMLEF